MYRVREQEALATAAERELLEETGYSATEWKFLITGPTSAGLTTEQITFFLARGLTKQHHGGGDHTEQITVHEVPLDSLVDWIAEKQSQNIVIDPKIFAGVYLAERN